MKESPKGSIAAAVSFLMWGILPIYWKSLGGVPALEILAHRIVWSLVVVGIYLTVRGRWRDVARGLKFPAGLLYIATALLIGGNWLLYVWAVNSGHIVESSLGFFINPLANVLMGAIFLREKLSRTQIFCFVLALAGVIILGLDYGRVPWIALGLASLFGTYGLLRKISPAGSSTGLFYDMAILSPFFIAFILLVGIKGEGHFAAGDLSRTLMLAGAGVVTAVPLLLFAYGARQIKYSTLGFLQYIAPTGQLMIGVLVYKEAFGTTHAVAFGLIWLALAIFTASNIRKYRRNRTAEALMKG